MIALTVSKFSRASRCGAAALALGVVVSLGSVAPVQAQFSAMNQAIAEGVAENDALAQFYRSRDFAPLWIGEDSAERRNALLTALERARDHGLPVARYEADALRAAFMAANSPYEMGQAEVLASQMFLAYARDVQTGLLDPDDVVEGIVQAVPRRDQYEQLVAFSGADPHGFIRALPPRHPEYLMLMREKLRLERVLAEGGWGDAVPGGRYEPGDEGFGVVALRDRLMRMGYLNRSATMRYDDAMAAAVSQFQENHGLTPDGIIITQFNGAPAGQTVFHLHFHIIPKTEGDSLKGHAQGGMAAPETLEKVAEKIRSQLK